MTSRAFVWFFILAVSLLPGLRASDGSVGNPRGLLDIFKTVPPFSSGDVGTRCGQQSRRFVRDLRELKLWALQMYDASGKLPSGWLNGNVHALGDYWQCLGLEEELAGDFEAGGGRMSGKYCQMELYLETNDTSTPLADILDLATSHGAVRNTFYDGVKFFPSFSPMAWGLCVPSSCTHLDVAREVSSFLAPFNHSSGLVLRLKSDTDSCDVRDDSAVHSGTAVPTLVLLYSVLGIALLGTLLEVFGSASVRPPSHKFLQVCLAFSLRKNWRILTDVTSSPDDISCVHGVRFIFSMAIYFIHRGVFGMFVPFSNRTAIARSLEGDWTMLFRAFWSNVDSFVVLSGLLTSYYSVRKLQSGQRLNILYMYAQRYYKFTPMLLVTLLIVRNVAEKLRSGPNAIRVAKHFVRSCQTAGFWKNLLYIGNLDGMNNMCYPPSHQLVTDMQMYLLSPFIILLMWRFQRQALRSLAVLIFILTVYKGQAIVRHNMGSFIYYGATLSEMLTSADEMYLNPLHRLTPYLFGLGLGFFLRTSAGHLKMTTEQVHCGWCAALLAAFYSFFGPSQAAHRGYQFDVRESAIFGMLQPVLWSSALCWVIFACHTGRGGFVNKFLSWKGFTIFSKLSYAFYLTQILVIFWGISGAMTPEYMRLHQIIDLNEIVFVFLMSVTFSLLFLLPLSELRVVLSNGHRKSRSRAPLLRQTPARSVSMDGNFNFDKLPTQLQAHNNQTN